MKNRILGLILVFVLLVSCLPVSAQTYNLQDLGVSYDLPNTWNQIQGAGAMFTYAHSANQSEIISITVGDVPGINDVSEYPLEQLEKLCSDALSDNNLAQMYAQATGLNIYVQQDEVSKKYAHWNTNNFYTYEKFFYIWTDGVAKEKLYHSLFISFNGGKMYVFEYRHNNQNIHTADFSAFLKSLQFTDTTIKIFINGKQIFPDSNPVLVNDRTLVPIRAVAEAMGYTVSWDELSQTVMLKSNKANNVLRFAIGSDKYGRDKYSTNGNDSEKFYKLDVPAQIIGSRTYLPLRAVAEGMDAVVRWEGDTNSVHITY